MNKGGRGENRGVAWIGQSKRRENRSEGGNIVASSERPAPKANPAVSSASKPRTATVSRRANQRAPGAAKGAVNPKAATGTALKEARVAAGEAAQSAERATLAARRATAAIKSPRAGKGAAGASKKAVRRAVVAAKKARSATRKAARAARKAARVAAG
jgi:hypothetical protein